MNSLNPLPCRSSYEVDDRLKSITDITNYGHLRQTKNQKLKRLCIDETNQAIRTGRTINFSDAPPVKVTAKFDYIGGTLGSASMAMSDKHDAERSRFPKIEEMAHFHYDTVDFTSPLQVSIFENKEPGKMSPVDEEADSVKVKISCRERSWVITRSLGDFIGLDLQFHKCVFDRQFTGLESLKFLKSERALTTSIAERLKKYVDRLSRIAGNTIWCGPILNWFEVDNKGNHLMLTEDSAINVPAVAAAHVIKRYTAQASDEISFEVGDIVSVIDMPPFEESSWWRGKHEYEVGFFPSQCVQVIGDSTPRINTQKLTPVASKRGKVVSYLRTFLSSRPSRVKLLQSGILRERTFGCDLGEHLQRTGKDIPLVAEMCTKLIENCGITNGVYRLSGMSSNVQKIRLLFDSEDSPNLEQDCFLHDIHCVGSVLKMYFRELPNPLLTYHLYEKFTNAVRIKDAFDREIAVHHVVQQLPPPHYRTVEFLFKHLSKLADFHKETGMHAKNLSIVWAPNLLRPEKMDESCTLEHLGYQAVVIEFLIRNVDIFFDKNTAARTIATFPSSPKHVRERSRSDPSVSDTIADYDKVKIRPASVGVSPPPKLISLEEARTTRNLASAVRNLQTNPPRTKDQDVPLAEPESSPDLSSPELEACRGGSPLSMKNLLKPGKTYIDVGEGPSAVPEYHTVIELPGRKSKPNITRANRKWKSLFGKRPDSVKLSSGSSLKRPPARQRSFEAPAKTDSETAHSKSVDGLSREKSPDETEKGRGSFISNPVTRHKASQQIARSKSVVSKSKFYIDTDLPPEGTRGVFVKSSGQSHDVNTRTSVRSDGRKCLSESSTQSQMLNGPPPRPLMSPPPYEQSINRNSTSRTKNSPGKSNGDESTFFVAGRVNQRTNAKTVEVFRAPSIHSLKTGRSVSNEESAIVAEGRVPLPGKE